MWMMCSGVPLCLHRAAVYRYACIRHAAVSRYAFVSIALLESFVCETRF